MLVVTRHRVDPAAAPEFLARARATVGALAGRPGCRSTYIGRAVDDATLWVIASVWDAVGSYRRAIDSYDVKVTASPLLAQALDEPTAFELLETGDAPGATALAADAGAVAVGEAAAPVVPTDLD
ncbi:MAG: antibiotic biosynthesis monooxygenase [Jiangellaceae bacterium]|nr:antibiotic biosynthesis monooxygenase [Jiangellaceae bacterium]